MMNKRLLIVSLLAIFMSAQASEKDDNIYQSFFLRSLTCEKAQFHESQRLKMKEVADVREEVWRQWMAANEVLQEERLIELSPLSEGKSSQWSLPERLEPNAVMPYYWGAKGDKPEAGYPVFLYLHGSGPKAAEWSTGLILAKRFHDAPSIYFIPQIPNEGAYYRWYLRSKQFAWERLFRQVMLKEYVNPNRLYVFGISEGGYGSQRFASFYADYLAAAGPMAGGEPLKNAPAENCGRIGFSFLTGALDKGFYRDILTTYTKEAFDSLQRQEPNAYRHRIELVPNRAHAIDYSPTTPWLKQFVRNPWPKRFSWEDFEMDGIHRSGFYNLVVSKRPDEKLRTRYDMNIEDNVIDLTIRNVEYQTIQKDPHWGIEMKFSRNYTLAEKGDFIIYLNEHLVDLKRKVTLRINGKEVYKGKVKCDVMHMVNSLATFYDSQRIFPAAISVSLEKK